MRPATPRYQLRPKRLTTAPDPTRTKQPCQGTCNQIPDEVCEAVFETLDATPRLYCERDPREALATLVAPRMATEGWRFCPCFPAKRTSEHARIFDLVHTNMANRLAHRTALEQKAAASR
jgi:hypothetical protein